MRVVHSACHFRNEFHRAPDRHGFAPDHFIELAAFNKLHAEITLAIKLAYLIDGNDSWVLEASRSFGLAAESFQVRFGGPRTQAKQFERDSTVQTLLMGAINNGLAAPADFLKQRIVTKFHLDSGRLLSTIVLIKRSETGAK
jgi:hypothetical protein